MVRRLVRAVMALGLLATPALAAVPPAGAHADFGLSAPSRFSPNGDRVKDTLRIRYTLPRRAHVRLTIGPASKRVVARRVDLGVQSAGTHT